MNRCALLLSPWRSVARPAQRGFTLLEMLIVVSIAGLAIVGLAAAARPVRDWASLIRFERLLIDYVSRARSQALREGRPVGLGISMQHRVVMIDGWRRHLAVPDNLDVSMTSAREASRLNAPTIVFLPDGTCSGGNIRIGLSGPGSTPSRSFRVLWANGLTTRED